jgi:hypothetical protein
MSERQIDWKKWNADHKSIIGEHLKKEAAQKSGFVECDSCRAKSGSPDLCSGCLSNRHLISQLKDIIGATDV